MKKQYKELENLKPFSVENLKLAGFELVSQEDFDTPIFPVITFKHGSVVFNTHAIKMLDECTQVQFLINSEKNALIVRPCDENEFHSVQWSRVDKNGKTVPKVVYGKPFTGLIFYEMYWDFKKTYKIKGELKSNPKEKFLIFKLEGKN